LIGITTRRLLEGARSVDGADREYADVVALAGGLPVLLACQPGLASDVIPEVVDGLLLSGGGDVDPRSYQQQPSPEVGGVDPDRDLWELELVRLALRDGVPMLGICRGCQVLNVALGGTLVQHLPEVTDTPHLVVSPRNRISHRLEIFPGTQLSAIVGRGPLEVNTIHHQAVDRLGAGLRQTARSPDFVIEGIEHEDRPAIGVQWHPECLSDRSAHRRLFDWLIERSRARTLSTVSLAND
jgi:putative glutamine amidotransferase